MSKKAKPRSAESEDCIPARQLLYSRKSAAKQLGDVSTMTLVRLEKKGALKAVRPFSKGGQVFYKHADLIKLVNAREAERGPQPRLRGHATRAGKPLQRKSAEG